MLSRSATQPVYPIQISIAQPRYQFWLQISKDEQGVTVLSEDSRNKRNEAMALYQQVLDIHEEASGPEDVDVALALYQMGCMRLELVTWMFLIRFSWYWPKLESLRSPLQTGCP